MQVRDRRFKDADFFGENEKKLVLVFLGQCLPQIATRQTICYSYTNLRHSTKIITIGLPNNRVCKGNNKCLIITAYDNFSA